MWNEIKIYVQWEVFFSFIKYLERVKENSRIIRIMVTDVVRMYINVNIK